MVVNGTDFGKVGHVVAGSDAGTNRRRRHPHQINEVGHNRDVVGSLARKQVRVAQRTRSPLEIARTQISVAVVTNDVGGRAAATR